MTNEQDSRLKLWSSDSAGGKFSHHLGSFKKKKSEKEDVRKPAQRRELGFAMSIKASRRPIKRNSNRTF